MIRQGRVAVNRKPVRSPGTWVDPKTDSISLDGKSLRKREPIYLAMHKPPGIVTTRSDERGRMTVYDLLPQDHRWVFPIGRLDKESSGLLLLTNDTRFGERVANPAEKIPKRYRVRLDKPLGDTDWAIMQSGMELADRTRILPAEVCAAEGDASCVYMTISEGKNRQIRRMCETLGYEVLSLKRLSIGPVELGDLPEGRTRRLTPHECKLLLSDQEGGRRK
jgi:pseudouridine synthase